MNDNLLDEDLEFRKIKSLDDKYEINENGTILRNSETKQRIKIKLDMHHSEKGYYTAFICYKGKVRRLMIHKLVAECWLGIKPNGLEIDHIDRDSKNNHYTNLRYVTHSEQMKNRVLSDKIKRIAALNCKLRNERVSRPIDIITPDMEWVGFKSHNAAARYLGGILQMNSSNISKSIIDRGKDEFKGYKLIYLDRPGKIQYAIKNKKTGKIFNTNHLFIAAYFIANSIENSMGFMEFIIDKLKKFDNELGEFYYVEYIQ